MLKGLSIIALVLLAGCASPKAVIPVLPCPTPSTSKAQLLSTISRQQADLIEFAAKGSAKVHFFADDRTESLSSVTAYFSDKSNVVIKVSHTFGTAMVLGKNSQDFWCHINFSKIDDFYSGDNLQLRKCGAKGLRTFPVTEAMGIIDIDGLQDANMFFEDNEYGLEVVGSDGRLQRSYSFSNCTAELVRITYYEDAVPMVVAKFSDYKPLNGSMSLPKKTTIFSLKDNLEFEISTSRYIQLKLTDAKRKKLYSKPKPSASTSIYRLEDDCQFQLAG